MRKPWVFAGAAIGYVGIVLVSVGPGVGFMVAGWAVAQIGINFALAAVVAMLPDQIMPNRRGRVASMLSLGQNLGIPVGTFIVQLFPIGLLQNLIPSAVGLGLLLLVVIPMKDRVRLERPTSPFGLKTLFGSFVFDPRKHPDLGWAWITRFCLVTVQITATSYLTYFLIDRLAIADAEAPNLVFQATLANGLGLLLTTVPLGWISDKVGRRKPFVIGSALVAVIGLCVIAFAPSFTMILVGQFILGAGLGSFLAVELALISDVLPSADDAGKDLGVVNIAQALPQSLVPAVAPAAVAALGYSGLFLGAAGVGLLGAFFVTRVKKVR